MAQNDLLGFERLIPSHEVTGHTTAPTDRKTWDEVLVDFWKTPLPRVIRAVWADGMWHFSAIGGTLPRLLPLPARAENLIILRFAADKYHMISTTQNSIKPGDWIHPLSPIDGPNRFPMHIASVKTNDFAVVFVSSTGTKMETEATDDKTLFQVVLEENPITSSIELQLDGDTKMKAVGRCTISLKPFASSWSVPDADPNRIQVFRLDGDTRVVPSLKSGWNLHAYGWMLQTAANFNTSKFLMSRMWDPTNKKTFPEPYHYVGCHAKKDGRAGVTDVNKRYVDDCGRDASGSSHKLRRLFGMEQQKDCWVATSTKEEFHESRNQDTETTSPCESVDNRGLPTGRQSAGIMSIYEGSWANS